MKTETKTFWVVHRFNKSDGMDLGYLYRYSIPNAIMCSENLCDFCVRLESPEEAKTLAASVQNAHNLCIPEQVEMTTTYRVRRLRSNFHGDC